jgi:hypothetical protein
MEQQHRYQPNHVIQYAQQDLRYVTKLSIHPHTLGIYYIGMFKNIRAERNRNLTANESNSTQTNTY